MSNGYEEWNALLLEGKTVASARVGKDAKGYDCLNLLFSDGTVLKVTEEGQTGWFKTEIKPG